MKLLVDQSFRLKKVFAAAAVPLPDIFSHCFYTRQSLAVYKRHEKWFFEGMREEQEVFSIGEHDFDISSSHRQLNKLFTLTLPAPLLL